MSRMAYNGNNGSAVGGVVLGGDYQGLGIARSLGRSGIPVCVIDDEVSIARYSRYVSRAVRIPDMRDEQETVSTILDVGRRLRLEGWVLYPTRDETVAALARRRKQVAAVFRVPTAPWSAVRCAWDKRNTYRLAGELGIPAPRTWYPRTAEDLERIDCEPPFVIKPAIKENFVYATKAKAWRADSRAELGRRFSEAMELVEPGEMMVQEMIPGDGRVQFAYCSFFKQGRSVASMVVQRRRQHPPDFGRASTFVETVGLPQLEELSERFLEAIDYYGLVELEYKLDARDGEFKLLDVNARTWGYHSIGPAAGVDFPQLLFADQLGETVPPTRAKSGVRWVRLLTDVPTGAVQIARGRLGCRAYLRSLGAAQVEAVFTMRDPLPGLAEIGLVPYLMAKRGF